MVFQVMSAKQKQDNGFPPTYSGSSTRAIPLYVGIRI